MSPSIPTARQSPSRRPSDEIRDNYPHFQTVQTRWMDNDIYGHVNNVVYYSFFDTVINKYLISQGGLDIASSDCIGLAVETHCQFHRPLTYPVDVDAGLRVAHLGSSSVRYEVGLFAAGDSQPAATGYFVHVFVDRLTRRPRPIPDGLRAALLRISAPST